ncbi:aromatic amino acid transaminase [Candidatus Rhabdochlamydia porcellionis]|nr:aromatic amino acid transaminase [Candidatus Rhabdochlamydia porcellionis]
MQKKEQNMGVFDQVPLLLPDSIFQLNTRYQADTRKNKVDLGIGVYKNENLLTEILPSVEKAEKHLLKNEKTKTYLPIEGDPFFLKAVGQLVFGTDFFSAHQERLAAVQAIGGTGALRLAGTFLKQEISSKVYISDPTWLNHQGIFENCGLQVYSYPYLDKSNHCIVFEKLVQFLSFIEERSILVLHACCHNPTGMDLSPSQSETLLKVCKIKKIIPLFDCAYLGLGESIQKDRAMIRMFAEEGIEMLVAFSCSKNFGLYAERVGILCVLTESCSVKKNVTNQLKKIIRTNYSTPPKHGAQIVTHILSSDLKKEWELELFSMRKRMYQMRHSLCACLKTHTYWKKGLGMFGLSGLNDSQVKQLQEEYAIYMTANGRMNFCGLNADNIEYVAQSLLDVICEK